MIRRLSVGVTPDALPIASSTSLTNLLKLAAVQIPLRLASLFLLPGIQKRTGTARAILRPLPWICASSPNFLRVFFGSGSNVELHGPGSPCKNTSRSIVASCQAASGTYTEQAVDWDVPPTSLYGGIALLVNGGSQCPGVEGEGFFGGGAGGRFGGVSHASSCWTSWPPPAGRQGWPASGTKGFPEVLAIVRPMPSTRQSKC